VFYARQVLTLVAFASAIVLAIFADYKFIRACQGQWQSIVIGVIVPLIVFWIVLRDQNGR